MLDNAQAAVRDFSITSKLPVSPTAKPLAKDRLLLRAKWMQAELDEFIEARDFADQVDATVDLIYYALGVFVEMGVEGGRAFELVHAANMKKVINASGPIYDEEGKVLKPKGWSSPREDIRRWLLDL